MCCHQQRDCATLAAAWRRRCGGGAQRDGGSAVAVEPFKLHSTSMSYIYKVFEHLEQLWMGIWQHTHTVTTTEVSPDLGLLAEILDDVRAARKRRCGGVSSGGGSATARRKSPQPLIDANTSRPLLFENRSKRYRWHAKAYEYASDDLITQALKKPLSETSVVS